MLTLRGSTFPRKDRFRTSPLLKAEVQNCLDNGAIIIICQMTENGTALCNWRWCKELEKQESHRAQECDVGEKPGANSVQWEHQKGLKKMATSTEQGLMVFQELYVLTAQPKRRALHITHPYHQPVCVRSKQRSKYPGTKRSPLLPLLGLFLTLHLHHAHENKTHFEFSGISQKRCWPNK